MNKFLAILYDSFLEVKDRKIFYLYLLIAAVMVLFFAVIPGSLKINGRGIIESGIVDEAMITDVLAHFFNGFFGFMIFLMVFGSAGLVPSFLRKGRVELNLSKPINRYWLISMKFFAVFLIMIAILTLVATVVWLTISLRTGLFFGGYFYGLLLSFVQFLIVYSIVFIIGILTNSGAAAIMGYFIIRIGAGLLAGREVIYGFLGDSVWKTILDVLYHILPKIGEMSGNYISLMTGNGPGDIYPVWSSLFFAAAVFLLALLYFNRRDY